MVRRRRWRRRWRRKMFLLEILQLSVLAALKVGSIGFVVVDVVAAAAA